MSEWWNKHISLFIKYKLSEKVINDAVKNLRIMAFRKGAKQLLKSLNDRKIPIIIISAGIGNFIKQFLIKNECDFDNIYIISNFIKFQNGIAIGVSENIIHSLNKNEVSLPDDVKKLLSTRPNIILLGDSISDLRMAKEESRKNALKIAFLEENIEQNRSFFENKFDIVCENSSYEELKEQLSLLKY